MAFARPQNLALVGARANASKPPKDGNNYTTPGRMFLKGANTPTYQEEYVGRDFGYVTLGVTAFAPISCVLELYGRGGDSRIPILLETFEVTDKQAQAFRYEGPCFDFMALKLVSITGTLEGVSWLEYQ